MNMNMGFSINKRFWISFILCIPIFIITTGDSFFNLSFYLSDFTSNIIQLILSFFIVFVCGSFFYSKAWDGIVTKNLNMFDLIAVAVIAAWIFSFYSMFYPQYFPDSFKTQDNSVPVFFASSCYITMFVLWGHMLEMNAKMKIHHEIEETLNSSLSGAELETTLNIVKHAHNDQMPVDKIINKISQFFIVIVFLVAILAFIFWDNFGPQPASIYAFVIAMSVLLAACPCALTLAAPISISITLSKASKKGILINNPVVFEEIYRTQNVDNIKDKDIITIKDNPNLKSDLLQLTNNMMQNIKENLILGVTYNVVMVPIATGIFYPFFHIIVGPVFASVAMSISSLIVIINALRLRKQ